jgi:hypothetical protein
MNSLFWILFAIAAVFVVAFGIYLHHIFTLDD